MSSRTETLCSHCSLPTGLFGIERALDGEKRTFCCYGCCLAYQVRNGRSEEPQAAWLLIRLGIGGFLAMNIMLFSLLLYSDMFNPLDLSLVRAVHVLLWILATPVLVILGGPFIRNAWKDAVRGRATSDTLIALGSCGAYGYSVVSILTGGQAVYFDTVTMVLVLFTLGRYLEAAGRAHCARSLEPMLNVSQGMVTVIVDGQTHRLPESDLVPGMTVCVAAGERVATDGIVLEGRSRIDESMLTGESCPVEKTPGVTVLAGTLNGEGRLLVRSTATGSSTRWARICQSVREALARKSPMQRLADRVAGYFVPAVLVLASVTVIYHAEFGNIGDALLAGMAVLVVACPCALGLATPLATSLGIARAARRGCLIRGGEVFEALAGINAVAFDKTGTLTSGQTRVTQMIGDGVEWQQLLAHAAALEQGCHHPTALGIVAAANTHELPLCPANDVRERPGLGVVGKIKGITSAAGNARLMDEMGWTLSPDLSSRIKNDKCDGHTLVYVGWGGCVRGALILDEELADQSRVVVARVHDLGMATCLLTGDGAAAAQRIAEAADVGSYRADLSPEDKVTAVTEWISEHGSVAMVGDGINDGPVLSAATVGVAVGSATDMAREAADVVLPPGGLDRLPWLLTLSHKVYQVIISNLFWAFGYNAVALSLAVAGVLQPILAAALMAGSSLIVVFNSLRLEYDRYNPDVPLSLRISRKVV